MLKKFKMKTVFGITATIFLSFTLAGVMIASKLYVVPFAIGIVSIVLQFITRNE